MWEGVDYLLRAPHIFGVKTKTKIINKFKTLKL